MIDGLRDNRKSLTSLTSLTDDDRAEIQSIAGDAITFLPQRKRIARIDYRGRKMVAVRTFAGFQVQSADRRRLILDSRDTADLRHIILTNKDR